MEQPNVLPVFRKLSYLVTVEYVEEKDDKPAFWKVHESDGDYEYSLEEFQKCFYPDDGDAFRLWSETYGSVPDFTRCRDEG